MSTRTLLRPLAALSAITLLATGCSGGGSASEGGVAGELTVLTWRTDLLEDGTLDEYADRFNETYPDVTVVFEGITDYEGEIRTRMNTTDYGDVLAIPSSVTPDQLSQFFEPLGTTEEMGKKYRWIQDRSFEGQSYGIPVVGNAQGILINKRVWEEAGVTETPTSPEEFVAAMRTIKEAKPEVIPVYTNYKDGWPLSAWENYRGGITADVDYVTTMAHEDDPWSEGKDHYVIDSLLYDLVAEGLTEEDPTSTNWELSKTMMADGEIATMFLGSWAIPQMRAAAEDAGNSPDDIGYLPFPAATADGTLHAVTAGDYNLAINVNSDNKEAARAWIDWFIEESGYAASQEGLSPLIDAETPESLKEFESQVTFITLNPAKAGQESLLTDIDKASEIGLTTPELRQGIVDAARTKSRTKEEIFADLNQRWAAARAQVG